MEKMLRLFSMLLVAPLVLTQVFGCAVHYKETAENAPAGSGTVVREKVLYQVRDANLLSSKGTNAVETALREGPVFRDVQPWYETTVPDKGIYLLVEPEYQSPTMPAIVFGYLSISTMTLLPAWSNQDGYNVYYRVYLDGELAKTYKYETRRFMAVWAFLLPVSWVNLMTGSEQEAFTGMTRRFLDDVQPLMAGRVGRS